MLVIIRKGCEIAAEGGFKNKFIICFAVFLMKSIRKKSWESQVVSHSNELFLHVRSFDRTLGIRGNSYHFLRLIQFVEHFQTNQTIDRILSHLLSDFSGDRVLFGTTLSTLLEMYRMSQKYCAPVVWLLWRSCRFNRLGS